MGHYHSNIVDKSKRILFTPTQLGPFKLKNKVVMAAMTRCRADDGGIPNDIMVKYYTERAQDAGFVITECSAVCKQGDSYPNNGGAYTKEQITGWKRVVDSVHKVGGIIFCQMFHCGRSVEKSIIPQPLGPSPIANRYGGKYEEPKEMTKNDIKEVIHHYIESAKLIKEAGFDGIEIDAGNGYLIDQFLRDCSNQRTDDYGGSVLNRCKLLLEIIDELTKIFEPNRIGVKLSPVGRFNDMFDSNPKELLAFLLPELNMRLISFVEICQADLNNEEEDLYQVDGKDQISNMWDECSKYLTNVKLIANNGLNFETGTEIVKENKADLISFGKMYISNPDLSFKMKHKIALNVVNWDFVYTGGKKGYIDYPKHLK